MHVQTASLLATRLGSKVIAHKEGTETLYYGTDHLGSSVLMTDVTGATVWTGAVTPFVDAETTEGLAEHVMLTGKELDTDTGLYYYNARWYFRNSLNNNPPETSNAHTSCEYLTYDPQIGRFITEDPARNGNNYYIYVSNNPLTRFDPTGLEEDYTINIGALEKQDFTISYFEDNNDSPITVTFGDETYTLGEDLDFGDSVLFDATFSVPEGSSLEIEEGDTRFKMDSSGDINLPEFLGRYNDIVQSG